MSYRKKVVIIGAGFTGMSAALKLLENDNIDVEIIDSDSDVGGLAGGFDKNGVLIEKFYHHWFASDKYINDLVKYIDCEKNVVLRPTKTGMYYANNFYNLSTPIDLLKFSAISLPARIRLGLAVVLVRAIKNWKKIEHLTAYEWLTKLCGKEAFEVVWKPLLDGKFGPYAEKVGAVWFWKKLTLRGGSRSSDGREVLQYFEGGFLSLARKIAQFIEGKKGRVSLNETVNQITKVDGKYQVSTTSRDIEADVVLITTSPNIAARLGDGLFDPEYSKKLKRINYLANLCIVLELNKSLSDIYWLNVNDPEFPFVGVIEHTNFEPPEHYNGKHLVYLSKYLPMTEELYTTDDKELIDYLVPFIQKMFPDFDYSWIESADVWRADYAQPIMEPMYSSLIPEKKSPEAGVFLSNMSHIYPEDRGTNYAVRDGFDIADTINAYLEGLT